MFQQIPNNLETVKAFYIFILQKNLQKLRVVDL